MVDPKNINWEALKEELEKEEWYQEEPGMWVRTIFLGTVFALTPSGKYYTPWAAGNVTEEEALKDQKWFEELEREAERHGLTVMEGADPCDILVGEVYWGEKPPVSRKRIRIKGKREESEELYD